MSNIIKKARLSTPISLPFHPPAGSGASDSREANDRTLDFSSTVAAEIARHRGRFGEHIASSSAIRDQQMEGVYRNGYEKGYEEGILHERLDRFSSVNILLYEAKRKKEQAVRDIETKVIELAASIAERIIGRSISANPDMVADIVRETMAQVVGSETVVLKVSEDDMELVNAQYERWLDMSGNAREFRIEADRRLRRGDCIVETEGGLIDAVLSSRLDYLVDELIKHA